MLKSRTALITGASAGIGKATAEVFARNGARLILVARREENLRRLAAELADAHSTECHLITLDVRDRLAVNEAIISSQSSNWPSWTVSRPRLRPALLIRMSTADHSAGKLAIASLTARRSRTSREMR